MCVPTHVFSADVADVENAAVVAVAAAAAAAAAVRVRARVRVSSAAARGRARAAVPQAVAAAAAAAAVRVSRLCRVISTDSAAEPGRDPEGHGAEAEAPHLC